MELNVKHDTLEYEIVINGVLCDFCGKLKCAECGRSTADTFVCGDCMEHVFN